MEVWTKNADTGEKQGIKKKCAVYISADVKTR